MICSENYSRLVCFPEWLYVVDDHHLLSNSAAEADIFDGGIFCFLDNAEATTNNSDMSGKPFVRCGRKLNKN